LPGIAAMVNHSRPKAGVFAVRQGKPLFENVYRITSEKPLQPFHLQKHHLALIGLGDRQAIAAWGSLCIGPSSLLWFWKNWIDRRFMAQFKTLPGVILQNP
jgi:selenide, water dikinase